jgi:hypothetical protein
MTRDEEPAPKSGDAARPRLNEANLAMIKEVILATFDGIEEPAGISWAEFERRAGNVSCAGRNSDEISGGNGRRIARNVRSD